MPELSPEARDENAAGEAGAQGNHRRVASRIMTFEELHDGEVFTDNTKIEKCKQCKDCMLQSDGTAYTNDYQKGSCLIYPYPGSKPDHVLENTGKCEDYEKDE